MLFGRVTNAQGAPLPDAQVTVWQTAADGRYDIQNSIEEIDCRGIFRTDDKGNYLIRTVRPLGYYIPLDGPVGQMVMAQKRHGMRPAHIHFLISAPGYRELVTALYLAGDEHLEDDVVFGASGDLVAEVKGNDPASPIKGVPSIHFDFSLSRKSEADRKAGRVGGDPAAITEGNGRRPRPTGRRRRRWWPPAGEEGRHTGRAVPRQVRQHSLARMSSSGLSRDHRAAYCVDHLGSGTAGNLGSERMIEAARAAGIASAGAS